MHDELEQDEWISKSEKKRNTEEFKVVVQSLMKLSSDQRHKIPMSNELSEAILLATKLNNTKEAFRRQMKLVGKILRQDDVEEIKLALLNFSTGNKSSDVICAKFEGIRDEMLKTGDEAVNNFLECYPGAERQKLRQLIRQAKKEEKLEKPLKSARELFKYIKSFN